MLGFFPHRVVIGVNFFPSGSRKERLILGTGAMMYSIHFWGFVFYNFCGWQKEVYLQLLLSENKAHTTFSAQSSFVLKLIVCISFQVPPSSQSRIPTTTTYPMPSSMLKLTSNLSYFLSTLLLILCLPRRPIIISSLYNSVVAEYLSVQCPDDLPQLSILEFIWRIKLTPLFPPTTHRYCTCTSTV